MFAQENDQNKISGPLRTGTKEENIELMLHERKYPYKIVWLFLQNCGPTLTQYINSFRDKHGKAKARDQLGVVCDTIYSQIETLRDSGVVHGDLHPENICVHPDGTVYFLDFGWCMSSKFHMEKAEKEYYQKCLAENFDKKHFLDSLESFDLHFLKEFF